MLSDTLSGGNPGKAFSVKGGNFLVTGPPRCGKSTLIERVVGRIQVPTIGFFTREIRQRGQRVGFSITTLAGNRGLLAHKNISSPIRVGKYGVNLEDIDRIAVPAMIPEGPGEIVVVDEIGKMECHSPLFTGTLLRILSSENMVIGTIALKGDRFIEKIKKRDDVTLVTLSGERYDFEDALKLLVGEVKKVKKR